MKWVRENAPVLEAFGAVATAIVAALALLAVKVQLDHQENLQKAQSARDIYREFLALSIQYPQFSEPDVCQILQSKQRPSYEAFVEYMLYTAEQVVGYDQTWAPVFETLMAFHTPYFCAQSEWTGYTSEVEEMILKLQLKACTTSPSCQ